MLTVTDTLAIGLKGDYRGMVNIKRRMRVIRGTTLRTERTARARKFFTSLTRYTKGYSRMDCFMGLENNTSTLGTTMLVSSKRVCGMGKVLSSLQTAMNIKATGIRTIRQGMER